MSFYVGVWNSPTATSDDEAAARYLALSAEKSVDHEFNANVHAFYCRLTSVYPEIGMIAEDELDASPWAGAMDISGDHVTMDPARQVREE